MVRDPESGKYRRTRLFVMTRLQPQVCAPAHLSLQPPHLGRTARESRSHALHQNHTQVAYFQLVTTKLLAVTAEAPVLESRRPRHSFQWLTAWHLWNLGAIRVQPVRPFSLVPDAPAESPRPYPPVFSNPRSSCIVWLSLASKGRRFYPGPNVRNNASR
jgi:hypothetical protein